MRVQQYPVNEEDALDLTFVDVDQTEALLSRLRHSLIGKNVASFIGEMSVFTSKQLRDKKVVAVIEKARNEIVALFPSNEPL